MSASIKPFVFPKSQLGAALRSPCLIEEYSIGPCLFAFYKGNYTVDESRQLSKHYCWESGLPDPTWLEGKWTGMFHIYVDESGKSQNPQNEFTALCGFVGHVAEWQRFSTLWINTRLRWQVPPIHMARIMNPDKCEDGWKKLKDSLGDTWPDFRDTLLDNFASIVFDAGLVCIGLVVDSDGYRQTLASPECLLTNKDANVFSFHHIIMRGIESIATVDQHSPIGIIVDDDPQNITAYYNLLNGLRIHPDPCFEAVKRRVSTISFSRDDDYPGLQAADMTAYLVKNFARQVARDRNAIPSELLLKLTHAGLHAPQFFDGQHMIELGKNIKLAAEKSKKQ